MILSEKIPYYFQWGRPVPRKLVILRECVEYLVISKFPFFPNTRSTCYGPARRIVFLHDLCKLTEEEEEKVVLSRFTRVGIGVGRHLLPTPSDRCALTLLSNNNDRNDNQI